MKVRMWQGGVPTPFDYAVLARVHQRVLLRLAQIPQRGAPLEQMLTTGIGLHNAQVAIAPSDPNWRGMSEIETDRLHSHLVPYDVAVHHIGSTSIPGLPAKPIIDLALAVDPNILETHLAEIIQRMHQAGYRYLGDWKRRGGHFFESSKREVRTHAVQLHAANSPDLHRLLRFRELMLGDPDLVRRYSTVKVFLAEVLSRHRGLYFWYKSHWLNDVLLEDRGPRAWGDWWVSARYPTMFQFVRRAMIRTISGGRRGPHPMAT